jgi:hypothetical protein
MTTTLAATVSLKAAGLTPDDRYTASMSFVADSDPSKGKNTGFSQQAVLDDGTITFSTSTAAATRDGLAGTVTAWLRDGASTNFNDPPVVINGVTQKLTVHVP